MHFDRRFFIIVVCSLGWGLIVSLLFYRMAAGTRRPTSEKVLIVAAVALSPGSAVTAESVKSIRVPEYLFPKGGYSKAEDVVGRPAINSIQPDEAVVESRLAARGSGYGVAPMIPTGMRAVSIRVNDVAGVAGFVLPGMRVDVLVTGKPPGAADTCTSTVLQNVPVLSAGQAVEADGKQSMAVPVVTLLVNPAQAESLTLAASEGHIQLVLRNSGDQIVAVTKGSQLRELYVHGNPSPLVLEEFPSKPKAMPVHSMAAPSQVARAAVVAPPPAPAAAHPTPPEVYSITLLHGTSKTVETFAGETKKHEISK